MSTPRTDLVAKAFTTSVHGKNLSPSMLVECSVVHLYVGPIVVYIEVVVHIFISSGSSQGKKGPDQCCLARTWVLPICEQSYWTLSLACRISATSLFAAYITSIIRTLPFIKTALFLL